MGRLWKTVDVNMNDRQKRKQERTGKSMRKAFLLCSLRIRASSHDIDCG